MPPNGEGRAVPPYLGVAASFAGHLPAYARVLSGWVPYRVRKKSTMATLILLRHGESAWNRENRFTGWTDIDLTPQGIKEAHRAAELLGGGGYTFSVAYTSVLKRAIRTLWIVMDDLDLMYVPVHRSWRLNEKSYGALQGLNKQETAGKYGAEQVHLWRRAYDVRPPPPLAWDDPSTRGSTPAMRTSTRRAFLRPSPCTIRSSACSPAGRTASRGTLRQANRSWSPPTATASGPWSSTWTGGSPDDEIAALNIPPTGYPLVYELGGDLTAVRRYYLGDPEEVAGGCTGRGAAGRAGIGEGGGPLPEGGDAHTCAPACGRVRSLTSIFPWKTMRTQEACSVPEVMLIPKASKCHYPAECLLILSPVHR